MTLVASGEISIGGSTTNRSINVEFGLASGATTSMSQLYRGGGIVTTNNTNVPTSGAISVSNFYGATKRYSISYVFDTNTPNASINVTTISGYVAGLSDITITVNNGIYVYSTSTSTPALTLSGGTTGDTITVVNNGFIMGCGGVGGNSGTSSYTAGQAGGAALSLGFNTTVNNTYSSAYIGGGGGGGGAGFRTLSTVSGGGGGGGAGGGAGGSDGFSFAGGSGGSVGNTGSSGGGSQGGGGGGAGGGGGGGQSGGGGGGRIFAGTGGAGGGGFGGAGGSANNAGGTGVY